MHQDKLYKIAAIHGDYIRKYHKYRMMFWDKFDYTILTRNIMYYKKKGKFQKGSFNDVIITADTETSKDAAAAHDETLPNHVCAWTISIRAYHCNIVTLYGTRPSEFIKALKKIREALKGDDIYIYFHNLSYDYVFLRLFLFDAFGTPVKQLNTKPHYPIMIGFENHIIIKDSLILAGCKLEKWASDLNVNHKKAVGSWQYNKTRQQGESFTRSELHYIENDTLALAECIDALCINLNKNINSLVYTATGIVREEVRERAKQNNGHRDFLRKALTFEQFIKFQKLYHGGYSHGNRYYIGDMLTDDITKCRDFASSYPFCLIAFKYPDSKFIELGKNVKPSYIINNSDKYAFIFKVSFFNIRLKDAYMPMPPLQASKCESSINMEVDNGRIIKAGYCSIYMCEQDLIVMDKYYKWDEQTECSEVEFTTKSYLPRWFTDYIFELYRKKCELKPLSKQDPVAYALAKSRVNSVYGLTVQRSIREEYIEVTEPGEYKINLEGDTDHFESGEYRQDFDKDMRKEYEKYLNNPNTVLNYQIGSYCTAYAFRNLFELGECVNKYYKAGSLAYPPHWYYSDTDSCYSDDWNEDLIKQYNDKCKQLLTANGYGPVIVNNKEYWLGIAEPDSEYNEFVVLGSKRYAGRSTEDNELHITVAGVPKTGAKCLKDELTNFRKDFIFDGKTTGKLSHFYIFSPEGIYKDDNGNEIGDSIDLQPCDYELDAVDKYDYIETEDYCMEYYDPEDFNLYEY